MFETQYSVSEVQEVKVTHLQTGTYYCEVFWILEAADYSLIITLKLIVDSNIGALCVLRSQRSLRIHFKRTILNYTAITRPTL